MVYLFFFMGNRQEIFMQVAAKTGCFPAWWINMHLRSDINGNQNVVICTLANQTAQTGKAGAKQNSPWSDT